MSRNASEQNKPRYAETTVGQPLESGEAWHFMGRNDKKHHKELSGLWLMAHLQKVFKGTWEDFCIKDCNLKLNL